MKHTWLVTAQIKNKVFEDRNIKQQKKPHTIFSLIEQHKIVINLKNEPLGRKSNVFESLNTHLLHLSTQNKENNFPNQYYL